MGLAASQARLLTITSRLSSVELKQQRIAMDKMRLANDQNGVSEKYTNALSNKTLKISNGSEEIPMNYSTLAAQGYSVIKSSEISAYSAAEASRTGKTKEVQKMYFKMPTNERAFYELMTSLGLGKEEGETKFQCKYKSANLFRHSEYSSNSEKVVFTVKRQSQNGDYNRTNTNSLKNHYDYFMKDTSFQNEVKNYAISQGWIYDESIDFGGPNRMQHCFGGKTEYEELEKTEGYTSEEDYSKWNSNSLIQGLLSGYLVLVKDGQQVSLSSATDIIESYDKTDDAAAEAEYNAQMNKINRKEKILDMQAKRLDTEYSALTNEYNSIKTIIDNHTQKDFSYFS